MRKRSPILYWLMVLAACIAGCGDNIKLVSDASITSFSINGVDGTINNEQITVALPFGTDVTNLTPTITFVGQTLSPQSGTPQDFTSPVIYTVTADDGTERNYTATVNVAKSGAKELISFVFEAATNSTLDSDVTATISGTAITATVPFGTDVTALVATFQTTGDHVTVGSTTQASGSTPNNFTSPVTYTVHAADGSTNAYTVTVNVALNTAKAITAFSFEAADNTGNLTVDVQGNINGTSITATVPFGTDVTALVATFQTTGDHVNVGAATQVSGTTANDFTSPVTYTVFAADNSTTNYTVTITIAQDSSKAITQFDFLAADNPGVLSVDVQGNINGTSITATVPFGTNVTALVAAFATTGASVEVGATAQVSGTTANNFTSPVMYTVTAADNSTQVYTVTVTVALNTAKDITSFQFLTTDNSAVLSVDVTATITNTTIVATVPFGTDISSLIARFTTTGASVNIAGTPQMSGVTANNFTTTLTYTVVASDGTTKDYTVMVINNASNSKDITAFSINGVDGIISGTQITLTLPIGTDLTNLSPQITITGVSVNPASGAPNNFTSPATYVVTAADNTTKSYTVTVTIAGSSAKDITRFVINGLDAIIANTSATTGTITLNMPNGTVLTSLTPIVTITGVSVSPASGVAVDFSNGTVNYVVTAADGTTKTYAVNIGIVNGNGTKVISSFSILGVEGQITSGAMNGSVTIVLPLGTDLTAQTPTIVINGSSISPPSFVPQDFTQPVVYTVTAADGSTRMYTVTVTLQ